MTALGETLPTDAAGPRLVSRESVAEARDAAAAAFAEQLPDAIVCASDSLAVGAHLAEARQLLARGDQHLGREDR